VLPWNIYGEGRRLAVSGQTIELFSFSLNTAKINPLTKLIQALAERRSRSGSGGKQRAWDLWGADYLLATCSFFVSLPKKKKNV
jgi:hypothetical protein